MDVSSQVKVELVHGDDLRVTSSGGSSLDSESGSLGGLTDAGEGGLAEVSSEGLSESNGGRGLALSEGSGSDTGDDNVLSVAAGIRQSRRRDARPLATHLLCLSESRTSSLTLAL